MNRIENKIATPHVIVSVGILLLGLLSDKLHLELTSLQLMSLIILSELANAVIAVYRCDI